MHVLARLKESGKLTAGQEEAAVLQAQRSGERVEEALIDMGLFTEQELLRTLARLYQTHYVSTAKLARASIDRRATRKVPFRLVERFGVCPILYDEAKGLLSVVVAAPGEDDCEKHVQVASGVREVRSYVARPSAIRAAIAKAYQGEADAFEKGTLPGTEDLEVFIRGQRDGGPGVPRRIGGGVDFSGPRGSLPPSKEQAASPAKAALGIDPFAGLDGASEPTELPVPDLAGPAPLPLGPQGTIPQDGTVVLPGRAGPSSMPPPMPSPGAGATVPRTAYVETFKVFSSLLDKGREGLGGHSAQVARLCREVAARVGLGDDETHALEIAAYLHDIGKGDALYHLTPLNVAKYDGHRTRAEKAHEAPLELFAGASLPQGVTPILKHLYERWDGTGFPDELAGKDVPFGARILALCETYADLIANPKNPYRRVLHVAEALGVIEDLGGTLFDPTLAGLLIHQARQRGTLDRDQPLVLLVDPDPEDTAVLELRLLEQGYRVAVARDFVAATRGLAQQPQVIVAEVTLGSGEDGFALLEQVGQLTGERPPFLFLTSRSDRSSVSRAFELGAADYVVKPASPALVAAKAGQLVEATVRKGGGVSGSLREMSLPDVVQILATGRKSGKLVLVSGPKRGEVHFNEGQVYDCRFGELGQEDAFYALLKLTEGSFSLDPTFTPDTRRIRTSAEGLLLEGMRRLDEGLI
jgi:response regulator RpfG family c-di-GMP phosphodiesterase